MKTADKIAAQLDQISSLVDGWYEGRGVAPAPVKLALISECLGSYYPENVPLPVIVPTPEGDLLFEWKAAGDPSLDVHLESLTGEFHVFNDKGDDVEASFALQTEGGWRKFFAYLEEQIACQVG